MSRMLKSRIKEAGGAADAGTLPSSRSSCHCQARGRPPVPTICPALLQGLDVPTRKASFSNAPPPWRGTDMHPHKGVQTTACHRLVPGMGSWVVFICGALMSMHVLGINLAPLLTVVGISGIVVGLSAQVGLL